MELFKVVHAILLLAFFVSLGLALFRKGRRKTWLKRAGGVFVIMGIVVVAFGERTDKDAAPVAKDAGKDVASSPRPSVGAPGAETTVSDPEAVRRSKTASQTLTRTLTLPDESNICRVVDNARDALDRDFANDLQRSKAERRAKEGLLAGLPRTVGALSDGHYAAGPWRAEVEDIIVVEGEDVRLVVELDCDIVLRMHPDRVIAPGDPVYDIVAGLSEGDDVVVAGILFPPDEGDIDKGMAFEEGSIFEAGALREPEFFFTFVEIRKGGAHTDIKSDMAAIQAALDGEKTRLAADEAARAAELQECRADLTCWGRKYHGLASGPCERNVAGLARYAMEWTDTLAAPRFSKFTWSSKGEGIIRYVGDRARFQNGFGAWVKAPYECHYDPASETVVHAEILQ